MSELGARLRQARTEKNLSIDDIQALTKIQKRYLHGIEEGNYEAMPGPFYVRAFIRQYADAVGLHGDELLEQYKNEIPAATRTSSPPLAASTTSRSRGYRLGGGGNRLMEIFPMILVALFVIAILAIAYVLSQRAPIDPPVEDGGETEIIIETQDPEPAAPAEDEEADETTSEEETEAEPVEDVSITPTGNQGEDSFYDVEGIESLNLSITFTGDSWLSIRDASGVELLDRARIYTALDGTVDFELPEPGTYRVRVARPDLVTILINDTKVEYQKGEGPENLYFNWTTE
ncbi:helix-turn-helix domain-containing protein [Chryseomicrobium excrementi]|uniref:Helix-turn-helix domain-containing protein n=1 Tax=Chryseomicrobium excrementi TaxID=2041346 RepID=A0A2M9F323_9BACL|nr:helix-turn-helix domain-containing protein [Chryseomicrobium excrementi]PJK17844.1 helix-turn-helix domain-containing protein [Chryseomicrobium excrementi]